MRFNHLAIVGVGLIGGSFAKAVRRAGVVNRITGWGGKHSLAIALQNGVIDGIEDSFDRGEVSEADLIYLSAPVSGILDFLRKRGHLVKSGAIVTDAGSTKREICRTAGEALLRSVAFVGGHPMAGSHRVGVEFARADLFERAAYAIVRNSEEATATSALVEVVRAIGARPVITTAEHHDQVAARISHVPQLLSTALALATAESVDHESTQLSGRGFADMTRLANSPWSIWNDICDTNADEIGDALAEAMNKIEALRLAVASGDSVTLSEAFRKANEFSHQLPSANVEEP
jgi:prephenate dehydrogenase